MSRKILLILLGLFLICPASAIELSSYDATVTLSEDRAYEEINIFAKYSGETEIKLSLPPDVNNLIIEINGVQIDCDQNTVLGATEITCPVDFKSDYYLKAQFDTNYVLVDLDERYLFKQKIIADFSAEKLSFRLKLPEGGMIPKPVSNYVTPTPTNIYSDGRTIILLFEKHNVENDFEISMIYERSEKTNIFTTLLLIITVILIVSAAIFFWLKKKKKEAPAETILLKDEKKIIDVLKNAGKPIRQKDIEKQIDFSKAKLSRILRSLEERGLLKKTPHGNTNIIELLKKR